MQKQILYNHGQHFNNVLLSVLCRPLTRVVTKVQIFSYLLLLMAVSTYKHMGKGSSRYYKCFSSDQMSAHRVQLKIDTYSPSPSAEHTLVNMFSAVSTKESFHFSDV